MTLIVIRSNVHEKDNRRSVREVISPKKKRNTYPLIF
jgi:hypothetical protein